MSNEVKAWMEGYKINLVNQITILRNRISLVNAMLLEFDAGTVTPAPNAIDLFEQAKAEAKAARAAKKAAKPKSKKRGRPPSTMPPSKATPLVVTALEAAGSEGATAREVAEIASLPIGTASSRLSIMARNGTVAHDPGGHRYFALHSIREDNNVS
jgi:predicted Rossmann fold nucleotide-binding protein DprA/Smf involved in DNA uptake